jgi:iron complex outermembrane receptor protein
LFTRVLIVTGLASCAAVVALAADEALPEAAQPIEEIVVTAGFRPHELMSTAGAFTVIEPDVIDARAARHLEQVLAIAPNVNVSVGGSRARFIQMRGIGDLEQFVDPKHFPSVGLTIDGIELSNIASGALLFDTDQVEVLRGPQGTRFGAAALAGMVNIRGRDPGEEPEASFSAGYGNLDAWQVTAAAGGPLTDNLRGRLAVRHNERDGWVRNAFLGRDDTQGVDEYGVRGRLLWDATESVSADLTLLYVDQDNGYDAFSLDNPRVTLSDTPGEDDQEAVALGGRVRWQLDDINSVEFKTTWTDADETYSFDEDWVFNGYCNTRVCPFGEFISSDIMERERVQVAVDLRWLSTLGDWSWVLGSYFHTRDEDMTRERFGAFDSRYETHRYALYGQLEWAITTALTARAGIRGEAFDDEYTDSNGFDLQSNASFWSGEATLEYALHADTLLYATASRGAKPGGVNTSATSVQPFIAPRFQPFIRDRLQFDSESLFNKEIGLKGRYFDQRLALRLSAFHMDRSNAQLESWIYDATTFVFIGMLDNVDDAENYGVELEFEATLSDSLELIGRTGYLQTDVKRMTVFDLDLDDFRELRGRDQANAPRWQYYFGLNWSPLQNLTTSVSVEGRDDRYFGYHHSATLDGYALLNLSVAYRWRNATIRAWSRNLLNTQYAVHGLYFANDPRDGFGVNRAYEQRGEPRVYGLEISYAL